MVKWEQHRDGPDSDVGRMAYMVSACIRPPKERGPPHCDDPPEADWKEARGSVPIARVRSEDRRPYLIGPHLF